MATNIVDYSLELRDLHLRIYRGLVPLIPIPECPAKLVIATSEREYKDVSRGSRIVQGAAAFTVPSRNLIVLNAPRMMRLQADGTYPHCCTITHEYVHIGMHHSDEECLKDVIRRCKRRRLAVLDAVSAQGWGIRRTDELITICCEWVYCHHPRRRSRANTAMTDFGYEFIELLGWVRPDDGDEHR